MIIMPRSVYFEIKHKNNFEFLPESRHQQILTELDSNKNAQLEKVARRLKV